MTWWRKVAVVGALAGTLGMTAPAQAGYAEDAGWGALAAFGNLLYIPGKLTYSLLGGLTGGLAYGLTGGDLDTAEAVWTASMGGSYVLTPRMLQGQDPIAFVYVPEQAPIRAAAPRDDSGWSTAEVLPPGNSLDGASVGSATTGTGTGGGFDEQPAGGF